MTLIERQLKQFDETDLTTNYELDPSIGDGPICNHLDNAKVRAFLKESMELAANERRAVIVGIIESRLTNLKYTSPQKHDHTLTTIPQLEDILENINDDEELEVLSDLHDKSSTDIDVASKEGDEV